MSITFAPSKGFVPVSRYYRCDCTNISTMQHNINCNVCKGTGIVSYNHNTPSINLWHMTALALLAELGIVPEDPTNLTNLSGTIKNADLSELQKKVAAIKDKELRVTYYCDLMQIICCAMVHGGDVKYFVYD